MTAVAPAGRRTMLAGAAVCSGVTVANIYLAQPIVGIVADDTGVSRGTAGWIATASLLGYALGILFVVPLGDNSNRRALVGRLSVVTSALLGIAAFVDSVPLLVVLTGLAAITTVVPQVVIPMIAQHAEPRRRGVALAWVQAGVFAGIMLSRVVDGQVGAAWGWRAVYLLAAALTLVVGLLTALVLPAEGEREAVRYRELLRSLPGYVRREAALRRACLRQFGLFGAFNVVWSTVALELTGPHGLSVGTAGLVGLLGLVGTACAPVAGRLVDRRGPAFVSAVGTALFTLAAVAMLAGASLLAVLLVALAVVPVALVISQVANQSAALAVDPEAGGRLNTVFMLAAFLGGSVGSAVGAAAFGADGWPAVCLAALGFVAVGAIGFFRLGARQDS